MSSATHRIWRQSWLVRASSQAEAMRVRAELNNLWSHTMMGEFEQACDRIAPAGVVLRISRLEVDIRLTSADDIGTVLPALVAARLAEQLHDVHGRQSGDTTGRAISVVRSTSADELRSALMHYLCTGSLHWSSSGKATGDTVAEFRQAAAANIAEAADQMIAQQSEHGWFRLLQLLHGSYDTLLARLKQRFPPGAGIALDRLLPSTDGSSQHHSKLALPVVSSVLTQLASGTTAQIAIAMSTLDAVDRDGLQKGFASRPPATVRYVDGGNRDANPDRQSNATSGQLSGDRNEQHSRNSNTNAQAIDRPSVSGAGLVLLHPFLPTFLQRVGVSVGDQISPGDLPRAAALLHHLATGRTQLHEFELGLIKVLLGFTPETNLSVAEGLLSDSDIEESDAMIAAVIGHWSAIGKTSVAGMRSTFLERAGILALEAHGWTLHVESSAVDMLLGRLPWGFGIVRLPWMQNVLHAEWTH